MLSPTLTSLFFLIILTLSTKTETACIATKMEADNLEEVWLFNITGWENKVTMTYTDTYNIPPMVDSWTYEFKFCDQVTLYKGNAFAEEKKYLFGWSFGVLSSFQALEVPPLEFTDDLHKYKAFKEFVQIYSGGDLGAPCILPRTTTVNIYCGVSHSSSQANCTQVPDSKGSDCIDDGNTQNGFCLCSIQYNRTQGICSGLVLNLLSNTCPDSIAEPIPSNKPNRASHVFGIIVLAAGTVIIVLFFIGYVYNLGQGKRGCSAVPCYESCTGESGITYGATSTEPTYGASSTGR